MKNFFVALGMAALVTTGVARADQCQVEIESQVIQIVAEELQVDAVTVDKTWTRTIRLLSSGQIEIYDGEFVSPEGKRVQIRFSVDRMCDVIDYELQRS